MRIERFLPHATIIISGICLVLFVLDRFNQYMHFMLNDITKWLVAILSILSILTSLLCIGGYLRADEHKARMEYEKQKKNRLIEKKDETIPVERI